MRVQLSVHDRNGRGGAALARLVCWALSALVASVGKGIWSKSDPAALVTMPTVAKPVIAAISLKSSDAMNDKKLTAQYEPTTGGNTSKPASATNPRRPMNPPQTNMTRTTIAKALPAWLRGSRSVGRSKNHRKANPDAALANAAPASDPKISRRSDGRKSSMVIDCNWSPTPK